MQDINLMSVLNILKKLRMSGFVDEQGVGFENLMTLLSLIPSSGIFGSRSGGGRNGGGGGGSRGRTGVTGGGSEAFIDKWPVDGARW